MGCGSDHSAQCAAIIEVAAVRALAVRQQHGEARLVRGQAHAEAAEHVGPVGKEGDPAEALGLALGAEDSAELEERFCSIVEGTISTSVSTTARSPASRMLTPCLLELVGRGLAVNCKRQQLGPSPSRRSGSPWSPFLRTSSRARTRVRAGSSSKARSIEGTSRGRRTISVAADDPRCTGFCPEQSRIPVIYEAGLAEANA